MSKLSFGLEVVGKVVEGPYKAPDRNAAVHSVEVTALVLIPNAGGYKHLYIFGTLLDASAPGRIVLLRADRFRPGKTVVREPSAPFVAIEGYNEGQYFFTPSDASFAPTERVVDLDTQAWAREVGGVPLKNFEVRPA